MSLAGRVRSLPLGQLGGETLQNGFASLLPMATTFVATTLMARITGPSVFGVWAFISAAIALVQLADLGVNATLSTYAMLVRTEAEAHRWLGLALSVDLAIVLFTCGVVLSPLGEHLGPSLRGAGGVSWPLLLIVSSGLLLATLWSNCACAVLRSRGHFAGVLRASGIGQGVYLIGFVGLAAVGRLGLTSALVVQALALASTLAAASLELGFRPALPTATSLRPPKSARTFALRVCGTNLAGGATAYAPTILCGPILGAKSFGVFALGASLALALRAVPLVAAAPIQRRIATVLGGTPAIVRSIDRSWNRMLIGYGVASGGLLAGLCLVVGGPAYRAAVVPALVLMAGHMLSLTTAIPTMERRLLHRPQIETWLSAITALLFVGLLVPLTREWGAIGPGMALVVSQAVYASLTRVRWRASAKGVFHA